MAPLGFLAVGVGLRLGVRSLWLDEAWLAKAIQRRAFDPKALNSTPIGFAGIVWVVSRLDPRSEVMWRLAPLLFGIAAVAGVFELSYRVWHSTAQAVLAAILLATNLAFVTYCRSLKPYTADVFFAVAIFLVVDRLIKNSTRSRWLVYVGIIGVAPLVSFPAAFVGGAASLVILWNIRRAHEWAAFRSWCLAHGVLAIIAALYADILLFKQRSGLADYWKSSGFPPPTGAVGAVHWYGANTWAFLRYLWSPTSAGAAAGPVLALGVGIVFSVLDAQSRRWVALFLLPFVVTLGASAFGLYPFDGYHGGRVLLFLLPGFVILISRGVMVLGLIFKETPWGRALLVSLVLLPSAVTISRVVAHPDAASPDEAVEQTRPLVRRLDSELAVGDMIYVYYGAADAFQFYAPQFALPPVSMGVPAEIHKLGVAVLFSAMHRDHPQAAAADMEGVLARRPARLWVLLSHIHPPELAALMQALGPPTRRFTETGALLLLYAAPCADHGDC